MLRSTLFIDPISFEFTNGPNMNEARAFFGCIVFKSRAHRNRPLVLISGGYGNTTATNFELALEDFNNNNSSLKSCEILDYSIGKKNFETFTDLPHSISGKKQIIFKWFSRNELNLMGYTEEFICLLNLEKSRVWIKSRFSVFFSHSRTPNACNIQK